MPTSDLKIAVIGSLTRDHIVIKHRSEEYTQVGGGVYYCSLALVNLGIKVLAVPLLAQKDRELLNALIHPYIEVIPQWTNETTTFHLTYLDKSLETRDKKILSWAANFYPQEIIMEKISECDAVHLTPLSSDEFKPETYRQFRKKFQKVISIDGQAFIVGKRPDLKKILAKNIDVIKLDDTEARHVTSKPDEKEAIDILRKWKIAHILITKAHQGSTLHYNKQTHAIPAYKPTQIIDATGCGDTYIAAYLARTVAGHDPVQAAHFAAQTASQKLAVKGALTITDNNFTEDRR